MSTTASRRIAEGACRDCGEPSRPGRNCCQPCADKRRARERAALGGRGHGRFDRSQGEVEWETIGDAMGCSKQAAQQTAARAMTKLVSAEHYERVRWRLRGALSRMQKAEREGAFAELRAALREADDLCEALDFLDAVQDGTMRERLVALINQPSAWERMMIGGR